MLFWKARASCSKAVQRVLPDVPHQLCWFHYLRELARPIFEADRHAKKLLKKAVRGVRPIERTVESWGDDEADAVRGYCLAVRSALTDDGRPPLCASGLKLQARLQAIHDSLDRVGGKGGLPRELARLQRLLARGLNATADQWPAIRTAYGWVHEAAHLLANHDHQSGSAVRTTYQKLLATMTAEQPTLGALAPAVSHFHKVTASCQPGLFHCYDVPDLPRTNNDLEPFFASARYHERRATGRKGALPSLVVRGSACIVAAIATRLQRFGAPDLQFSDPEPWRQLRQRLATRQATRVAHRHFRRDPDAYLTALEQRLSQRSLPP